MNFHQVTTQSPVGTKPCTICAALMDLTAPGTVCRACRSEHRQQEHAAYLNRPCPTCRADVGEWCDKRRNVLRGGPFHKTRTRKTTP